MQIGSLTESIEYKENRPAISVLLETETSKEIRIVFKKGQVMKEHTAPFPIVVEIFDGEIDFGVEGEIQNLKRGGLIALDAKVPHNLEAKVDSIVRLTLSKSDTVNRVENI